jgi:hypothetical protein
MADRRADALNTQKRRLPDQLIELLTWYATDAPIPDGSERSPPTGAPNSSNNTDSTAHAAWRNYISHLVYDRNGQFRALATRDRLASQRPCDGSSSNGCSRILLEPTPRYHRDRAPDLFDSLVKDADDNLLASRQTQDFLHRAAIDFERLMPTLKRMPLDGPGRQSAGAAWITLAPRRTRTHRLLQKRALRGPNGYASGPLVSTPRTSLLPGTAAGAKTHCGPCLQTIQKRYARPPQRP